MAAMIAQANDTHQRQIDGRSLPRAASLIAFARAGVNENTNGSTGAK
jgi:hypothetical protein